MKIPYQGDIELLLKELEHYEYIASKSAQEHQEQQAVEFSGICSEIHRSIEAIKARQNSAISEWASLDVHTRQTILAPLTAAIEEAASRLRQNSCTEFSYFLETFLSDFITDLLECKDYRQESE